MKIAFGENNLVNCNSPKFFYCIVYAMEASVHSEHDPVQRTIYSPWAS